ncbi:hypothetical protein ALUC_80519A [Aspergillus luchuensis]|nr:hypothetical protein ALUC_80519A [Aspergillus luchuensis]
MSIFANSTPSLWATALSSLSEKDRRVLKIPNTSSPDTKHILTEILAALETQRDRCKRDKWTTISIGGKELVIRDVCAKIAAHVKKFMQVVDAAVQYDPVHAALPWAGVRLLLQLTFNAFETFGAIVEGLEKATRLIARCGIIEALVIRHSSGTTGAKVGLEEELVKLYSAVLGFLCKAKKHYDGSRMSRWNISNIDHSISQILFTVTSVADGVDNMQTRLDEALADLDKPIVRIADEMSDLHIALKENERSELLQWLSTISVQQHYRETLASVLPGSGEWLLKQPCFVNWKDSSISESFWLHGIPGCGKTKLAAIVVKYLHRQSSGISKPAPIAHFFCSQSPAEPERSDAREILRSLLKQVSLIEGERTIRLPSVEAYQVRRAEASHTGEKPAPLTVEECVELICEIGRGTPLTIVIDALDECSSQQRGILIEALKEIRRQCRDIVKIFVSSRHETDIAAHFEGGEIFEITPTVTEEDISQFIRVEVHSYMHRWSRMHEEPIPLLQRLEEEIIDKLVAGAQGMFLWVRLQLESISDTDRIKDVESIRQAITSFPPTLNKSYEVIYERIQGLGKGPKTVALQSLQWLLCAKRKLSVSEFLAAVSRSPMGSTPISPGLIMDYCCNLVVIDNVADTFRFAHATVREFLESLSDNSILEADSTITQRCLGTYLWGDFSEDGLLQYATQYWPAHVEQLSGSSQRLGIQKPIIEFLTEEEHFEDWIEFLDERPVERGYKWSSALERKLEACLASPPSTLFTVCCFGLSEALECPEIIRIIDVNQTNRHGTSGLYLAARWGYSEVVRKLLQLGADVNGPGYQYGSPLQAASFGGHKDVVKILLDRGVTAPPTEQGEYSSPLQAALASGHDNIAGILIDSGPHLATQIQFNDALETASFKGSTEIVERLLAGKAGSFTPNIRPDPLQVALFGGKARQAKRLLQSCTDVNEVKGYFGNALAAAIAGRKFALVQLVVDAGADLNARGRFGFPLRAAAIANQLDIARYFVDKGADPNIEDNELGDPLQAAATFGKLDMMLLLLSHNTSVNGCGGHFGNALQAACFNGHEQAVRLLIDHGASLNYGGRYRDALQAAVYGGHERIVEILLVAGARLDLGPRDRACPSALDPWTERSEELDIPTDLGPLEVAARRGDVKSVKLLLAKGTIIDSRDARKRDDYSKWFAYIALKIAAFGGHLAVVECLLDSGVDINAEGETLGTPLQAALAGGHFGIADVLLSRGAWIDMHWDLFGSCLQVFCQRGHNEAVRFLLKRGANIEDRGGEHGNALQVACNAGHIDIVKLLLDRGANVRSPGRKNGNALQAASLAGHLDIVKLLVHHGIGVDEADSNSETALCLAAKNGDEHMMKFLLQQGAKVDGTSVLSSSEGLGDLNSGGKPERDNEIVARPLHHASIYGQESAVAILLSSGATVHAKGKLRLEGFVSFSEDDLRRLHWTPLFAACFAGHESTARRLFQYDPWGYVSRDTFTSAVEASLARKKEYISTMLVQEAFNAGFKAEQLDGVFKYACAEGYAAIVTQILEHCSLENWPDAVSVATKRGRSAVVKALLQHGANMDSCDEHGNLWLDIAIEKVRNPGHTWHSFEPHTLRGFNPPNWIDIVPILLCAGADSNDLPNKIREIVPDVVQRGSLDAWKALDYHQHEVLNDPELYPQFLIWASETGDLDKINYVADKYDPSTEDIKSAVIAAIEGVRNNVSPIKALMRLKTPLFFGKGVDGNGDSEPLVIASREESTEIVSVLLQYATHSFSTVEAALKVAISRDHVACARLILDSQFDNPSELITICSRLIKHCFPFNTEPMIEYLLQQGVSPNTRDPETGETLLYIAAMKKDSKGADVLISHGADVHPMGGEHGTALHAAAVSGSWKTVQLLLSEGADVNARGGSYGTPLIAVMAQEWEKDCWQAQFIEPCRLECHRCVARVLLEWDADVDAEGGEFGTALQVAERIGNELGIRMLMGDNTKARIYGKARKLQRCTQNKAKETLYWLSRCVQRHNTK